MAFEKLMSLSAQQRVREYYEATTFDYHLLWTGKDDLALHFGYYDADADSHTKALLRMNEVLADRIGITSNHAVLDAGCGYGGSSLWLADNRGCRVDGVNIVPFQIEKAIREARRRKLEDRVQFHQADYARLPFRDGSFDIFWGLESIVHAQDKTKVLSEAARVLKPQGKIILAEYLLREEPPLNVSEKRIIQTWLTGWAMPNLYTRNEYLETLRESGFTEITIEYATPKVLPSLRRLERFLVFGLPIGRALTRVGLFGKVHLGNILGVDAQMRALKSGAWEYAVVCAKKSGFVA